jgi:hypothetical protein
MAIGNMMGPGPYFEMQMLSPERYTLASNDILDRSSCNTINLIVFLTYTGEWSISVHGRHHF